MPRLSRAKFWVPRLTLVVLVAFAWFALDLHFPAIFDPHWPAKTPADELRQRGFGRDEPYSVLLHAEPRPKDHPYQFKNVSDGRAEFWNCIDGASGTGKSPIKPRFWVTLLSGGFWRNQVMDIYIDENGNGYLLRGDSWRKYNFHSLCLYNFARDLWEDARIPVHDPR